MTAALTITTTHHDAQTHAVQLRDTYRTRRHGWTSAAEFQRARVGKGRVAIPGGIREEDRKFLREGFYVVTETVMEGGR